MSTVTESARADLADRQRKYAEAKARVVELSDSVDPDVVDHLIEAEVEAEKARRRVEIASRAVDRADAQVAAEKRAAEEAARAEGRSRS